MRKKRNINNFLLNITFYYLKPSQFNVNSFFQMRKLIVIFKYIYILYFVIIYYKKAYKNKIFNRYDYKKFL